LGLEAEANRRFEPRGLSGRIWAPEVFPETSEDAEDGSLSLFLTKACRPGS
jgi:hypothetical protein